MYTLAVSRDCNVTCLLGSRRSGIPNVIAKPIGVPLLLLPRSLSPNNIDYIYDLSPGNRHERADRRED